jgi:hypothetical protein
MDELRDSEVKIVVLKFGLVDAGEEWSEGRHTHTNAGYVRSNCV